MSRNGLGNFNASDVIRRNQERMLAVAKLRNDNAKQQRETIQGLQSGLAGDKPITSLIIPVVKEAMLSLTIEEYNQIVAEFTERVNNSAPAPAPASAPAPAPASAPAPAPAPAPTPEPEPEPTVYVPQGTPARVFSLPYIVQGITLDASGNRIILTYDTTNNIYYIYKVLFSDALGNTTFEASGNNVQLGRDGFNNANMFLIKNSIGNYFIGGYTAKDVNNNVYPTIAKYDPTFSTKTTKVIRDSSGTIMTKGGINYIVTSNTNVYCSGWFNNMNISRAYTIDNAVFPVSPGGTNRFTPFFAKLDDTLEVKWVTMIAPETANAFGSGCTVDSQGNVYASVAVLAQADIYANTGNWKVQSGSNSQINISKVAEHMIVKFTDNGLIDKSAQFIPYGYESIGNQIGSQLFIDANDNIFVAYHIMFTGYGAGYPDVTINFGNGVTANFHRTTKSYKNLVILKLNSSLVAQAVYQLEMPSNAYNMWPKSIAFDASNNLLVNTAYTTGSASGVTLTDNHGNSIILSTTGNGNNNAMDLLITNDLTEVKWYYDIRDIRTDTPEIGSYYRNNGSLIVDNIHNRLVKIDQRANTGTVTVATGLTLPASTGIQTSFMVEYT